MELLKERLVELNDELLEKLTKGRFEEYANLSRITFAPGRADEIHKLIIRIFEVKHLIEESNDKSVSEREDV